MMRLCFFIEAEKPLTAYAAIYVPKQPEKWRIKIGPEI